MFACFVMADSLVNVIFTKVQPVNNWTSTVMFTFSHGIITFPSVFYCRLAQKQWYRKMGQ